jgi:hypothetical protein
MPRHRKPKDPGPLALSPVALVICTRTFHHDEPGYAELGYHLVGEIRAIPGEDGGQGRLHWTGRGPESGPLRTPMIKIEAELAPGTPPVKRYRNGEGPPPWRLRCSCGYDRQPTEARLAGIVAAWAREFPGRPAEIDLRRL